MSRHRLLRGFAVLTAALALVLTNGCSVVGGSETMTVKAYFADSAGLFVGNDVGVLGVNVGKITSIEPEGAQVLVTMEIDADQPVPADAGAVVVARSVATDRYVELTPVYKSGKKMPDGATIPHMDGKIERTRSPVDFDQVLASLNRLATGIGGNKKTAKAVQRFIDAGTEALRGKGPLLNQTIHSLAKGVGGLASQRENVKATLKSLDVLVSTIADNETTARRFITQVSKASKFLADERGNFRTTLRSLDQAVTTVAKFAVDNRQVIVDNVDESTKLMKTVLSKQGRLEEILRVMPLALQNLRAFDGDRLPVRIDPKAILPFGSLLQQVCKGLIAPICKILSTIPPRIGG
ncbi:MAG: MCE family protein [Nocardioidaceae bacterium]|nr:MCE family protein [Nocardioidaceae bacterium]